MTGEKDNIEQFGGISETFVFETLIVRQRGKLNWSNEANHYRAVLFLIQFTQTLASTKESFVFILTLQVQTICLWVFVSRSRDTNTDTVSEHTPAAAHFWERKHHDSFEQFGM